MARLFVSVRPPEPVLDAIGDWLRAAPALEDRLQDRLQDHGAAPRGQRHLTLRFLGEVDDVPATMESLRALEAHAPFTVRLGGTGVFGGRRRRAVLWLGVLEGASELAALADAAAAALGLEPEPFAAHLTLRRLRRPSEGRALAAVLGNGPVGPGWTVEEVLLEESSYPSQPVGYRTLAAVPLRG